MFSNLLSLVGLSEKRNAKIVRANLYNANPIWQRDVLIAAGRIEPMDPLVQFQNQDRLTLEEWQSIARKLEAYEKIRDALKAGHLISAFQVEPGLNAQWCDMGQMTVENLP